MKRLIKKASAPTTLYHGTSLSLFQSIVNDGRISPRAETNNVSHMGADGDDIAVWYKKGEVHKNNEKSISFNERNVSLYDAVNLLSAVEESTDIGAQFDNKFVNLSDDLKNYVESETMKMLDKYKGLKDKVISNGFIRLNDVENDFEDLGMKDFIKELQSHEISIVEKEFNSNVEEYVVFLGTKEVATSYAKRFGYDDGVGVLIEVSTDESALGPDLNDAMGSIDFFSDVPLWKQSYDANGQVVQYGPIDISQITSVTFIDDSDNHLNFEEDDMDFDDFDFVDDEELSQYDEKLEKPNFQFTFNQPLSLEQAIAEINSQVQAEVTRLKKRYN